MSKAKIDLIMRVKRVAWAFKSIFEIKANRWKRVSLCSNSKFWGNSENILA